MSNLFANFNSSANFTSQITGITSIKHLSRFTRAQLLRVSLNTKLYRRTSGRVEFLSIGTSQNTLPRFGVLFSNAFARMSRICGWMSTQ